MPKKPVSDPTGAGRDRLHLRRRSQHNRLPQAAQLIQTTPLCARPLNPKKAKFYRILSIIPLPPLGGSWLKRLRKDSCLYLVLCQGTT